MDLIVLVMNSNHKSNAVILGIGGQDGYFLSHLLSRKGYKILGCLLDTDLDSPTIKYLPTQDLELIQSSVSNSSLLREIIRKNRPEFIFNLAGNSFVPHSWKTPADSELINGYAVGELLQTLIEESPSSRFFQACSSEMFGHHPHESPQNEWTRFHPDNPYGSSKVFAFHLTRNYRENYGIHACSGILYNHESEWRPENYVTRKITRAAAALSLGKQLILDLGDLNGVRDWSYAGDIVEAIWLMMISEKPSDYVLSSGKLHSVRDILTIAFSHVGLEWQDWVKVNDSLKRSPEGLPLCGDSSRAREELGWSPRTDFETTIKMMVDKDIERLK